MSVMRDFTPIDVELVNDQGVFGGPEHDDTSPLFEDVLLANDEGVSGGSEDDTWDLFGEDQPDSVTEQVTATPLALPSPPTAVDTATPEITKRRGLVLPTFKGAEVPMGVPVSVYNPAPPKDDSAEDPVPPTLPPTPPSSGQSQGRHSPRPEKKHGRDARFNPMGGRPISSAQKDAQEARKAKKVEQAQAELERRQQRKVGRAAATAAAQARPNPVIASVPKPAMQRYNRDELIWRWCSPYIIVSDPEALVDFYATKTRVLEASHPVDDWGNSLVRTTAAVDDLVSESQQSLWRLLAIRRGQDLPRSPEHQSYAAYLGELGRNVARVFGGVGFPIIDGDAWDLAVEIESAFHVIRVSEGCVAAEMLTTFMSDLFGHIDESKVPGPPGPKKGPKKVLEVINDLIWMMSQANRSWNRPLAANGLPYNLSAASFFHRIDQISVWRPSALIPRVILPEPSALISLPNAPSPPTPAPAGHLDYAGVTQPAELTQGMSGAMDGGSLF